MKESIFTFGQEPMVGVLTQPHTPAANAPLFVILNAGLVHRVGPSRTSVKIARMLARRGITTLRFDYAGKGDSGVRSDGQPFQQASVAEARAAMDALAQATGARHFVLMGLCSGAFTAFRAAKEDERIAGLILMNGQVYEDNREWNRYIYNTGWARWYLKGALFRWDCWKRALTGRIRYRQLISILGTQIKNRLKRPESVEKIASRFAQEFHALFGRGVRFLMVYSENDRALVTMKTILGDDLERLEREGTMEGLIIPGADHTFTLLRHQQPLLEAIDRWAQGFLTEDARVATAHVETRRAEAS